MTAYEHPTPRQRPTGRRRTTEKELRARAGLTGAWPKTSAPAVLGAFKRAAPALGCSRGLVDLVDYLLSLTWEQDWAAGTLWVWPTNELISHRIGREVSQVKALVRLAIDEGFIVARDHGTRNRRGQRDDRGNITYAFGFDLAPLAERLPEFVRRAAEYDARQAEARAMRREASRLRATILGAVDLARSQQAPEGKGAGAGGDGKGVAFDWNRAERDARMLAASVKGVRDPLRLARPLVALQRLAAQVVAEAARSAAVENHPAEPENRPPITTTNTVPTAYALRSAARPAREGRGGGTSGGTGRPAERVGALRGFPMTPRIALQIAPAFRDHVATANPTWPDISEAAFVVRGDLGISQHAYGQACQVLGRYEAASAIAAISAKHGLGLVWSPGGLLRSMVDAHLAGELRLDRTLFGLLDRTGGSARGRPGGG